MPVVFTSNGVNELAHRMAGALIRYLLLGFLVAFAALLGIASSASAAGASQGHQARVTHGYDALAPVYDGAANSVGARTSETVLVASEGVPGTAATATGHFSVVLRLSVAADTGPAFFRGAKPGGVPSFAPKSGEFRVDPETGFVLPGRGVSVFDNPGSVSSKGFDPYPVDSTSIPPELRVIQCGVDPHHYEVVPRPDANLTPEEFTSCLSQIQCGR